MAIVKKIIVLKEGKVNLRKGEVVSDVITDEEYFQIRTYSYGDNDRSNGSKQNIQLSRDKAIEIRDLLNNFINN